MDLGLKGQVAAVVGAASGIGRAIAAAFAAEGARVVLTGVDPISECLLHYLMGTSIQILDVHC
jgi:NAD(P)-dependent dehydrogenase (short-subunit alcohol dehydrogenase family)